jgi:hypothetical protein
MGQLGDMDESVLEPETNRRLVAAVPRAALDRDRQRSFVHIPSRIVIRPNNTLRTLAFGVSVMIVAVGAVGAVVPSALVSIAQYFVRSGAFYVIATVRVALGLVLISAAAVSGHPRRSAA